MKRGLQIEAAILDTIKNAKNPISTRDISLRINKAWHTIDRHCLKLQLKGKINGFRIGNINAWVIANG
jgi:FKBP-type peptidyl-prolyl cis-trans isomerase (trigger factor)